MRPYLIIHGQRIVTLTLAFSLLYPGFVHSHSSESSPLSSGIAYINDVSSDTNTASGLVNASHDNNIEWEGLEHDSRDDLYRTPAGPQPTGTSVILRLRANSGDLTAAKVRVFNDRQNKVTTQDMSIVADDGNFEWWQITLQPPSLPTVYWYRFIAIDGSDIDYYADDNERLGGLGAPSEEELDFSWQLTFYDPNFQTPDWVKNAIFYQIFTDRFRDGDVTNNHPIGSFYYGENSTIFRSNTSYWNQVICDPLNTSGPCPGVYGENFYGGDWQGVINKLDYLQVLGVTAILLNPIFRSPSNHGYDTTNYQASEDDYGDDDLLQSLVTQAADHGISIIYDGAFNFTSPDSKYFDLYSNVDGDGACETLASGYRDWYFFYDVAPGTGDCISSTGIDDGANSLYWQDNNKLAVLNSTNDEVQDQIWAEGTRISIAQYWLSITGADGWRLPAAGEIDPGALNNAANLYWEGFRTAIKATNPNAYIVGEEWGDATSWTLGSEWDASTNYQLSNSILGFWRNEPFTDNDHNTDSETGVIEPLLPSELNEHLLDMQERYPPEILTSMMNLLSSYDTNRTMFMLDHNTDLNNSALYLDRAYSWSDALTRMKGAVLLQMTLPGAPTIYYGDEVGLVGPVTFDTQASTWLDDPYNRQPYPWLDQSGVPYYTFLQSQTNQDLMRIYYTLLTTTRNAHPALRTGSFDPLLWDNPDVYAYGRRSLNPDDAAIIVLNHSSQTQSVTLNLNSYLPATSNLVDVLHNNAQYSIAVDGTLTIDNIPPLSGVLLIVTSGILTPPVAPDNLVAFENESHVDLAWNSVAEASKYHIFRSLVSSGGYEQIATTTATTFSDTDVVNGTRYYYTVRAAKLLGVVSEYSNEGSALPHWEIDTAKIESPGEITHTIGLTSTEPIFGQICIEGVTDTLGETDGILAQVGYGKAGTPPSGWMTWINALYDSDQDACDQFSSGLVPEDKGDLLIVYRFSTTNGRDWTYADLNGIFSSTPTQPTILHVLASSDTTPPSTPGYPTLVDWGDQFTTVEWTAIPEDPTHYAYDVYRSTDINQNGLPIARVPFTVTQYTDTQVIPGTTYYYRVQSVDTSFNRSGLSAQVTASTVTRQISVTFRVDVPDYTNGYVYIVGDHPKIGSWDPGKVVMTRVDADTWTITLTFEEGTYLKYRYTRGNYAWLDVETAQDGNTDVPDHNLLVEADRSGTLAISDVVTNWRDPLIAHAYPLNHATDVPINSIITLTWSQAMQPNTNFELSGPSGPITGTFTYNPLTWTVSLIPSETLQLDTTYTIRSSFQTDSANDPQLVQYSWTFTTAETITIQTIMLPLIMKN